MNNLHMLTCHHLYGEHLCLVLKPKNTNATRRWRLRPIEAGSTVQLWVEQVESITAYRGNEINLALPPSRRTIDCAWADRLETTNGRESTAAANLRIASAVPSVPSPLTRPGIDESKLPPASKDGCRGLTRRATAGPRTWIGHSRVKQVSPQIACPLTGRAGLRKADGLNQRNTGEHMQDRTVNEALDRYVEEVLPEHGPRTQKDYNRLIAVLRRELGEFYLDMIEPRDVAQLLDVRTGKIARNKHIALLSTLYSKCVGRWHWCKVNPCLGVERNPAKPRTRYITDKEYLEVYEFAPLRVQVAMDLALLTGQRQGDILKLKWDSVTKEGISFRQTKTGKKLRIGPSNYLTYVLGRARREINCGPQMFVLETRAGLPYTSEGFRSKWQRTVRLAIKAGFMKERHSFHDIRAKAVSDSQSLEEAMQRAGHSSMQMTRSVYDRGIRTVKPLYG